MKVKTNISDRTWRKRCRARLLEALEDKKLALKALEALAHDASLRRELPKSLYMQVLRAAL
jgi:hypothetical protein